MIIFLIYTNNYEVLSYLGCTPLYRAVMAQSLELSALLILGGANVDQFSMDCSTEVETPLIL